MYGDQSREFEASRVNLCGEIKQFLSLFSNTDSGQMAFF